MLTDRTDLFLELLDQFVERVNLMGPEQHMDELTIEGEGEGQVVQSTLQASE